MTEQVIDRAALDRKDKGELSTIVAALGGKATSRMKKSDLVDMILELSGAVVAGSDPTPDSGTPFADSGGVTEAENIDSAADEQDTVDVDTAGAVRSESRGEPVNGDASEIAAGDADRSAPGSARQRGDRPKSDRSQADRQTGNRPQGSGEQGSGQQGSGQQADRQRNDRGGNRQKGSGEQGSGEQGSGEQGSGQQGSGQQADRQRNDRGGNRQQGSGEQGSGQQGSGQQPSVAEDGEGGNRRRRRRGRGRDRDDLIEPVTGAPISVSGHLDLRDDGYGFLRVDGSLASKDDVYVPVKLARQFDLRKGDFVTGTARPANRNEKNPALAEVAAINGRHPDEVAGRPAFDALTPIFPDQPIRLERTDEPGAIAPRLIDLVAPIGKGQRGLIVSPPKAGKTTIMKEIARSIEVNHPEIDLIVLLIDERPEEVTDMRRHLERGEVVASTFDRPTDEHCAVAELTLERAKRMVEDGRDVVIMLDGITRLTRAYNTSGQMTGRSMSGGLDSGAIYPPKHFFGSARNLEQGGSLTVLATALVETGSKMDDVIFEEFKGTGNAEIRLDRLIAERRVFPAIDVVASSTRHEELLFDGRRMELIRKLRSEVGRVAAGEGSSTAAATEMLVERLGGFPSNEEFLNEIAKAPSL